jgi:hypothetical protein
MGLVVPTQRATGQAEARPGGLVLRVGLGPLPVVPGCARAGPNHAGHGPAHLPRAKFSGLSSGKPGEVATIDGAVLAGKTIEAHSPEILRDIATGVVAAAGLRGGAAPGAFALNQAPAILVYLNGAQVAEADD